MKYEPLVSVRQGRDWSFVAVVVIAALVCFWRLGDPSVYWWDEARVAINSLEMMHHPGLVVTFHDKPDLWNTKPPLAIWLNAFSMWLFAPNEWALRLPSAVAAVGTTVAVYLFAKRIADQRTGLPASLILLGIGGFVEVHVARTADFDSLLTLFATLTTFSLFFAFETKRFEAPAGFFFGALLTKGIAGGMMAPGWALYALIYRKNIRAALLPGLAVATVVILFYAARELTAPGYLSAVWNSDIMRYAQVSEGNGGPITAYLVSLVWPWQLALSLAWVKPLYTASAFPWSLIALLSLYRPSKAAIYLWCCLGSFLLVVSLSATHLGWYIAPAYPLIAVLAAIGVRRFPLLAFPLAIVCIGFNVWKIEKTVQIPPLHYTFHTPDGKAYRGPDEFYEGAVVLK